VTLALFAVVYACSVMSFMNNQWGWFLIPGTVVQGAILYALLFRPITAVSGFLRASRRRADLPAPMPRPVP
jgi:hypothetical protein